ncbi:MAG TPA: T9SS type A sorting domain-containing protein [Bacteroidetes bacterium]|nr:T9SS type A sorting domain-containing protein [Bacteroidota bacterium]
MKYKFTLTLLAILAFLGGSTIQAQSFAVSPSNTVTATAYSNDQVLMTINFDNLLPQDTLNLEWATISNSLKSSWSVTLCDYGGCYLGIPSGKVMDPVPPSAHGFLKLTVTPDNNVGPASVSFRVWEVGNTASEVTVTFSIDALTGVGSLELAKQVDMFPNPATRNLSFHLPEKLAGSELTILNLQGAVISNRTLAAGQTEVDVTALPNGSYIARLETKNGTVNKRFLKMN